MSASSKTFKVSVRVWLFAWGSLAALEHAGLLTLGVLWPLRHLAQYPGDAGVNLFLAEGSLLFLGVSLAAAARTFRAVPQCRLVLAMATALPCGIAVTLVLMRVLFLDPAVAYLTLLPGVSAVLAPYGVASWLTGRGSAPRAVLEDPITPTAK